MPRLITLLACLALCACAHRPSAQEEATGWAGADQLVLVTTADWEATTGVLRYYEREGDGWKQAGEAFDVSVGRAGVAWGIGLHAAHGEGPVKREGDGKAPAGAFAIGPAFGYAPTALTGLEYVAMGANDWCIDVPGSPYYNRIVDRSLVKAEGLDQSSEPMRRDLHLDGDQAYREGFVIQHNADGVAPQGGSCIFAHLWREPGAPTAGCTAMAPERMAALLAWLDARRQPVFVTLPQAEYARLRAAWKLPEIDE